MIMIDTDIRVCIMSKLFNLHAHKKHNCSNSSNYDLFILFLNIYSFCGVYLLIDIAMRNNTKLLCNIAIDLCDLGK